MKWIDEMFVRAETDQAAASAKRNANKVDRPAHLSEQDPEASKAWSALVTSITTDVNDFNKHHKRAGQTPACISQRRFECEVHVPGMSGKRLVLTLDANDLRVSVHPDFPQQPLTITIEPDEDGRHSFWVLGQATKERARPSVQQLSEYLLKPIFSAAATDRDR